MDAGLVSVLYSRTGSTYVSENSCLRLHEGGKVIFKCTFLDKRYGGPLHELLYRNFCLQNGLTHVSLPRHLAGYTPHELNKVQWPCEFFGILIPSYTSDLAASNRFTIVDPVIICVTVQLILRHFPFSVPCLP
jgi:hypothetical protein